MLGCLLTEVGKKNQQFILPRSGLPRIPNQGFRPMCCCLSSGGSDRLRKLNARLLSRSFVYGDDLSTTHCSGTICKAGKKKTKKKTMKSLKKKFLSSPTFSCDPWLCCSKVFLFEIKKSAPSSSAPAPGG